MSGLREGLGEWARSHGDQVAAKVEHSKNATERAIRTRRRRRSAAITGGTVAGIVGVVALASVVHGPTPVAVASNPPTTIESLTCEQPWSLQPGATTYDATKAASVGVPTGEWSVINDGAGVITHPDSVWAGYETLRWVGTIAPDDALKASAEIVAVQNNIIVGAYEDLESAMTRLDTDTDIYAVGAPYPGTCGESQPSASDGDYTFHLVITMRDAATGAPVESFVDPSGDITVAVSGLDDWYASSDVSYAHLREPEGDTYQAFVVAPPTAPSCTPLPDQLASGQPGADNLQYEVTIPGVQPITGEVWGKAPAVVIDDPDYEAWYVGVPSAIIAEEVDGGNPTATVDWTTGTTWGEPGPPGSLRLINFAEAEGIFIDTMPQANCAFTQPIPAIDGAVFLVIAGVDVAAVEAANPGADWAVDPSTMYTWVYLGQAG